MCALKQHVPNDQVEFVLCTLTLIVREVNTLASKTGDALDRALAWLQFTPHQREVWVSVSFQAKILNICWFLLLKPENLMPNDCKVNICGFWTVPWSKLVI